MILATLIDTGVSCGWTFYAPLSTLEPSSVDLLFFALHFSGLSSLLGALNFVVTIHTFS
jgi:heme/copper-type cytochrome/quinol oxidase subunit 1